MRRILAGSGLLAALFVLVAPANAAPAPAGHGAASIATGALLALAPDAAQIALATQTTPTASLYTITATATGNGSISPSGQLKITPGTDKTFTMTPLTCAVLNNVRVDGTDQGPVTTYTFHSVSADHTIEAIFVSAPPDTIVASAGAGGTISPAGAVAYDCGATATYAITANDCFLIGDVLVDGRSTGAVPSYTFYDLKASHTIAVSFVPAFKFTITATPGANGTITPSGAVKVNCGSDQTFTITPKGCYQIADVLVDGASQGPVKSYTFTNVITTHSIAASFVYAAEQDTITASAGPGGAIVPAGTIVVDCGTSQTFSISHDACYRIVDVLVDGISKGAVSSFTFTDIGASHSISASFASSPQYPITASAGDGGTIVPSGTVLVDCGADQTFTITPDLPIGHALVTVDGVSQGSIASYTFRNVNDAHTISVQFSTAYDIFVSALSCPAGQIQPVVRGGPLQPNTTYWFDVQPLACGAPEPGTTLAKAGSVQTNGLGNIFTTTAPCFDPLEYSLILDVAATGAFDPRYDPVRCFQPGGSVAATGIQDLSGEITPEGAVLSWWLMDVSSYRGFLVHRAPEGGEEEVVTPTPLAPPSSHPPAEMRWRDGSAVPGSRYAYRIEALKSASSDWYGPVTLSIPAAPMQLALRGAMPNPFSGTTRLALDMPADEGELRLDVFDVTGRHVRTIRPGTLSPGQDVVDWDGLDDHGAPARGGLYLVRLQGARGTSVMRILKRD